MAWTDLVLISCRDAMLEAKACSLSQRSSRVFWFEIIQERQAPSDLFPPAKRKLATIFPEAELVVRLCTGCCLLLYNLCEAYTDWMLTELEEVALCAVHLAHGFLPRITLV